MEVYESNKLWDIKQVDNGNPVFNYLFHKHPERTSKPIGKGIYMWVANLLDGTKLVCYTGSYKNNKGYNKVLEDRWQNHINSKTHRGIKLGFGTDQKFIKRFKPIFEQYNIPHSPEIMEGHITKSFAQSTANRAHFSFKYWDLLDMSNPFTIYWFATELDAKEIERIELEKINPVINGEINDEYDSTRPTMSVVDALDLIKKELY